MPSATSGSNPHFRKIQSFRTEYSPTTLTQYESKKTGMRIVVVDQEGPKVNGYFTLATEIHDDSGAPHTLEHLCFMGSKSYQYKGVLDKLATRAYSTTNAWTATDHTAYTLDTAGWQGFAQILPIYLEHVIAPTLTDAGCYTEVHHIDPEGNDAGVVYSEMQGVQNTQGELMDLEYKRLMYPEGIGFRYETGGMMEQLRTLGADRIRAFHKHMYQPKNLCMILVGAVDHGNLLDVVHESEETMDGDVPSVDAPFKRPWVESKQAPLLEESILKVVEFPEEDESAGEILISFFGPPYHDSLLCAALPVLLRYLAGSSASILDNTLVEKEQVASGVWHGTEFRPHAVIQFSLSSVATEELESVEKRFFELLREAATKPIDMRFMRDCINLERRQIKFQAESSADFFTETIIRDFLFGNRDGSTLLADLGNLSDYDTLEDWTDGQWKEKIQSWLSEAKHVTILGKPSIQLSEKFKKEEKLRVEARKEKLGAEGLERLAKRLAEAKAENDRDVPKGLLERFEIPDPTRIKFINTITARSGAARKPERLNNPIQDIIDKDEANSKLFIHFEHVKSSFATVSLLIGTDVLPLQLRPLLSIFVANFFSTPMMRDGKRIEFENIVMGLDRDTVSYGMNFGRSLGNSETLKIAIQIEAEKYQLAIRWLRELMFQSIFDLERIESTVARLLAEIPEEKRSGSDMVKTVDEMLVAKPSSIGRACCTLVKALYLKHVKKLLQTEPETLISQLKEINALLFEPSNFRILTIADVQRLERPVGAWAKLTEGLDSSKPVRKLETPFSRLNELGKNPGDTAYVIPMPTVDSSFLLADAKGPNSPLDPQVPAMMVTAAYLNAVEGPLWIAVRGTGLAYGVSLRMHTDSGHVSLDVYRSPDAFKAFEASHQVVEDILSGKSAFDNLTLEGAISSIVLSFADSEATMAGAAQSSFVRQAVREIPNDWPKTMLEKVRKVSFEEIKAVMRSTILPLFRPETSILLITCAPMMVENLCKDFEGLNYKPETKPLGFFQDDYGLGVEGGVNEIDEDELEDGDEGSEESKGSSHDEEDD